MAYNGHQCITLFCHIEFHVGGLSLHVLLEEPQPTTTTTRGIYSCSQSLMYSNVVRSVSDLFTHCSQDFMFLLRRIFIIYGICCTYLLLQLKANFASIIFNALQALNKNLVW